MSTPLRPMGVSSSVPNFAMSGVALAWGMALGLMLNSTQAFPASSPFELLCVTDPPTTSFLARQQGDKVQVILDHQHGPAYAPIHRGLTTGADLDTLAARARLIKETGSRIETEWPADSCVVTEDLVVRCAKADLPVQKINGADFRPYSFDTSWVIEKNSFGKFQKVELTFEYEVNGQKLGVPMNYDRSECQFKSGAMKSPKIELTGAKRN